jgi:predicted ATP-grasp superfamily ATP-dependent carboligase
VITDAGFPDGLALARALSGLGVPVYGLAVDPSSPCCHSSRWTEIIEVGEDSEQGWVEALLKLASRHSRQVLFPDRDTVVDIVSRHRDALGEHYLFVLPERATLRLAGDKVGLRPVGTRERIPRPAYSRLFLTHGGYSGE